MNSTLKHRLILLAVLASVAAVGAYAWTTLRQQGPGEGFVSGNGRIEATEVDVAAKLGGRVQSILVKEGDFVTAGQPLAHMQIDTLQASHDEARARHQQAVAAQLGRHVDFGGFDAAIAADKAVAGALWAQRGPGVGACGQHGDRNGQKNQPVFEGGVHGALKGDWLRGRDVLARCRRRVRPARHHRARHTG